MENSSVLTGNSSTLSNFSQIQIYAMLGSQFSAGHAKQNCTNILTYRRWAKQLPNSSCMSLGAPTMCTNERPQWEGHFHSLGGLLSKPWSRNPNNKILPSGRPRTTLGFSPPLDARELLTRGIPQSISF